MKYLIPIWYIYKILELWNVIKSFHFISFLVNGFYLLDTFSNICAKFDLWKHLSHWILFKETFEENLQAITQSMQIVQQWKCYLEKESETAIEWFK